MLAIPTGSKKGADRSAEATDGRGEAGSDATDLGGKDLTGVDGGEHTVDGAHEGEDQEQSEHQRRWRARPQTEDDEDDQDDPLRRHCEDAATRLVDQSHRDGYADDGDEGQSDTAGETARQSILLQDFVGEG